MSLAITDPMIAANDSVCGEPANGVSMFRRSGVYLRVYWATIVPVRQWVQLRGLSPRVRGNPRQRRPDDLGPRSIPAQYSKRVTFHYTFPLPRKPGSTPKPPKRTEDPTVDRRLTNSRSTKSPTAPKPRRVTKGSPAEKPATPKAKKTPEDRREYELARSQTPERKEYARQLRRKKTQFAKETGKCRNCHKPSIPGQTNCEECAERHRISRRAYDINRRAKIKEARDLANAVTIAEKIAAGTLPTKCRDCKNPPRTGKTRCESCADKHNQYRNRKRSEANKKADAGRAIHS